MDGIVNIKTNNTNTRRCSMGILLLVKRIAKHIINMVIKRAIPAYFDCSDPKNTSLILVEAGVGILYIYSNMIERKIKNDNHYYINIYPQ
jgi:hypothetical protein